MNESELREKIRLELDRICKEHLDRHIPKPHQPHTYKPPLPQEKPAPEQQTTAPLEPATPDLPTPEPVPQPRAEATPAAAPEAAPEVAPEAISSFTSGDILYLETGEVVIFKGPQNDTEYDIVYCLNAEERLVPQAMALGSYHYQKIGHLPQDFLRVLEKKLRWDRDVIVYHLDDLRYRAYIHSNNSKHEEMVTEEVPHNDKLVRGRKLILRQGTYVWEAIFWSNNSPEPLVAYQAADRWVLANFDVRRYTDRLEFGEILSAEEIEHIEQSLNSPN